jgi:hypothetical protein
MVANLRQPPFSNSGGNGLTTRCPSLATVLNVLFSFPFSNSRVAFRPTKANCGKEYGDLSFVDNLQKSLTFEAKTGFGRGGDRFQPNPATVTEDSSEQPSKGGQRGQSPEARGQRFDARSRIICL